MGPPAPPHLLPRLGALGGLILAAALFHLWDGRTIQARDWFRHGEEYVITLDDGKTVILRQQEVREVSSLPGGAAPARPVPSPRKGPGAEPRR